MSTTSKRIARDYESLTDGTKTLQFQVISGNSIELAHSIENPAASLSGYRLTAADMLITISPPTKAWVRAGSGEHVDIIVTEIPA